jgi:hypothetical protein
MTTLFAVVVIVAVVASLSTIVFVVLKRQGVKATVRIPKVFDFTIETRDRDQRDEGDDKRS